MGKVITPSYCIQWALYCFATFIKDVGIDHRGTDIHVSEQFLDSADIISSLQQMRCKAVAEGMATTMLGDTCCSDCHLDRSL